MPKGYLIDMDGVIYRGSTLIPGADRFIAGLQAANIPFSFLTNNSMRNRLDVTTKLARLGIDVEERHVFTCAMATARFIARQKSNATAFVIGEGGLLSALHRNGIAIVDHHPDYVVVGETKVLSFDMLDAATRMVMAGAQLIATNPDPSCPMADGTIRPGCGSVVAMIETATGRKSFSVGKPSPVMLSEACKEIGLAHEHVTMIGDTMETDILGGLQVGCRTVLVLSGGTKKADLIRYAYRPDVVVDSIADLVSHVEIPGKPTITAPGMVRSMSPAPLLGYYGTVH